MQTNETKAGEPKTGRDQVCEEIMAIMREFRRQSESEYGIDTPGGLEHMGDVWRRLGRWEKMITGD